MSSPSLPGFEIVEALRETSKTVTVKAIQRSLDRMVALTFLRPEFAAQPGVVQQFLSVARVCSQMKFPGFPQIYDIASDGDRPYIVLEHVEGQTVAERVSQHGPMPYAQALRIGLTISDALDLAWKQNRLVHRNLKPSEIRVDDRGTAKLTDFGRAIVVLPDGRTVEDEESGLVVGTPNFLSPEQVQAGSQFDCRADIYSLGATLYYMVTGCVPFPTSSPETVLNQQLTEQIPHPRNIRAELPAPVCGLLVRMMMKRPEDRYADWTEAMGDMNLALKNQPLRRRETPAVGISTVAPPQTAPPPESTQLRRIDASTPGVKPRAGRSAPPAQTPPVTVAPHQPALHIRILFALLLVGWLAVLANDRLENRLLHLPVATPLVPIGHWARQARQWLETVPPPATLPVSAPVAAHPPAGARTPPTTPSPTPAATTAPTPPPPPPPTTKNVPTAPVESQQPLPPDVVKRLAVFLGAGDRTAARRILGENLPLPASRLRAFSDAIDAIPNPLDLAEETLLKSAGQEVTISYMGKERRIIPRRSIDGTIQADFVSPDGPRPVTFKTARFAPDEIVKLLPQAETPALHAAWCIALLKANRREEAGQHAGQCGLLAPVFQAAAAAPDEKSP